MFAFVTTLTSLRSFSKSRGLFPISSYWNYLILRFKLYVCRFNWFGRSISVHFGNWDLKRLLGDKYSFGWSFIWGSRIGWRNKGFNLGCRPIVWFNFEFSRTKVVEKFLLWKFIEVINVLFTLLKQLIRVFLDIELFSCISNDIFLFLFNILFLVFFAKKHRILSLQ